MSPKYVIFIIPLIIIWIFVELPKAKIFFKNVVSNYNDIFLFQI